MELIKRKCGARIAKVGIVKITEGSLTLKINTAS
jgi:hypothetical protein